VIVVTGLILNNALLIMTETTLPYLFDVLPYQKPSGCRDWEMENDPECNHSFLRTWDHDGLPVYRCNRCGEKKPPDEKAIAAGLKQLESLRQLNVNSLETCTKKVKKEIEIAIAELDEQVARIKSYVTPKSENNGQALHKTEGESYVTPKSENNGQALH
jgi:hypothetical protein